MVFILQVKMLFIPWDGMLLVFPQKMQPLRDLNSHKNGPEGNNGLHFIFVAFIQISDSRNFFKIFPYLFPYIVVSNSICIIIPY